MKLKLIYPRPIGTNDSVFSPSKILDIFFYFSDHLLKYGIYKPGKRMFLIPPLNLMLLAAVTPPSIEVEIVDERTTPLNFEDDTDVVGITCMTSDSIRAYEIADQFRKRNIKVIMGGIHPTILPEEAIQHADAVVIGEAEDIFPTLLKDIEKGTLNKFYKSNGFRDLRNMPIPRRDLIDDRFYLTKNVVQITRGCPNRCKFCSVKLVAGTKYRFRPIKEVINEIEMLDGKFVAFIDDNLFGDMRYTKELFQALVPLKISWFGNATVHLAENQEMISLAVKSGCKFVLFGLESLAQQTLRDLNKNFNISNRYAKLIHQMHKVGIGVIGSFILGFDNDTPQNLDDIVYFANQTNLDLLQVSILTPYPGTAFFKEFGDSNRLITKDWRYYDTTRGHVVYQPKNMTPKELQDCYFHIYERVYSWSSIFKRLWGSKCFPALFLPYNIRQRKKIKMSKILMRQETI